MPARERGQRSAIRSALSKTVPIGVAPSRLEPSHPLPREATGRSLRNLSKSLRRPPRSCLVPNRNANVRWGEASAHVTAWVQGRQRRSTPPWRKRRRRSHRTRVRLTAGLAADVDALRAAFALGCSADAPRSIPSNSRPSYADLSAWRRPAGIATTPSESLARADPRSRPWDGARRNIHRRYGAIGKTIDGARGRSAARRARARRRRQQTPGGDARAFAVARQAGGSSASTASPASPRTSPKALDGVPAVRHDPLAGPRRARRRDAAGPGRGSRRDDALSSLPLGEAAPGRGAIPVSAWMTGGAPRIGLGRGVPEHDPWRFDASGWSRPANARPRSGWPRCPATRRPGWRPAVPSRCSAGRRAVRPRSFCRRRAGHRCRRRRP